MNTAPDNDPQNGQGTDSDLEQSQKAKTPQAEAEVNDGSKCPCEDWGLEDPAADDSALQAAILDLCKHYAALDKYARRTEVMDARRQRFYRRDDQYITWNPANWIFQPWTGQSTGDNMSPAQDSSRYTDVYNIYWPYMRALIAIGVQNPPGVNFEPDDPTKGTDIAASRAAEQYRHFVDRVNKRKDLQGDIMSLFCTDNRVVLYTRSVRDGQRFGFNEETGEPHSGELVLANGTLESKVPILAKSMAEWTYAFVSDELDINLAKQAYPKYAGKIKQGTSAVGESAYERMARIGVLQGTRLLQQAGDAYAHLATRHRVWLRPAAFNHAPDAIRDQLKELYPSGCKVIWCGDAYCGSFNVSMDDQLQVGFPGPGDGMSRASMLKPMVVIQDCYNDYKNLEKEIFDFTIPVTYRLSEIGDIEAIREQSSEPGNYVDCVLPGGLTELAQAFYREPPPESPPSLMQAYRDLQGALAQFITGAQPALFGGGDKDNDTAHGIAMLRDQAMGQFSIAWGNLQELMAGAYKQAILAAAQSRAEEENINIRVQTGKGATAIVSVSIADLKKGNFHAYPDTDSSFPETTGSKRQTVMSLVTQALTNPLAAEAYGVLTPSNLELQRELLGIEGWEIPAANSSDKQMQEIERLLQQKPMPNLEAMEQFAADEAIEGVLAQQSQASGVPAPEPPQPDPMQLYKCSIPVDVKFDFHEFEFATVKNWLSSPEGLEAARTNKWGVLNVKLHGLEHEAAIKANAPPPPPPGAMPPKLPPKGGPSKPALPPSPGAMAQPMAPPQGAPLQ